MSVIIEIKSDNSTEIIKILHEFFVTDSRICIQKNRWISTKALFAHIQAAVRISRSDGVQHEHVAQIAVEEERLFWPGRH